MQAYDLTGQVSVVDGIAKFNGNYSSVLLGAFKGHYVAIKVIKAVNGQQTASGQRKLLREVVLWGSMRHQNIHPFYGVAHDQAFGPFGALISPWCPNGDASQYLARNGHDMVVAARVNLWKGVIEGVVYLHGSNPPIVHGDLKPGNVLIDDFGRPRICDFGLSRLLDNVSGSGMTTTSEHTGTTRYLAPELVASEDSVPPTFPSDMYALGCLGLEFIYLQSPFSHRPNNPRGHLMILQDIRRGVAPSNSLPQQSWPSHRIWPLISTFWNSNPIYRPTASAAAQLVKCTVLALPQHVIQRVIVLAESNYNHWPLNRDVWTHRSQFLRTICLVSRTCCALATPALYRHIWLPGHGGVSSILALIYALTSSVETPLGFNRVADGYGRHIESLSLQGFSTTHRERELKSTRLKDLLYMVPHLRLVDLGGRDQVAELHPSVTLSIQYIWNDFDHGMTIPALPCLQRLCINLNLFSSIEPEKPSFPAASSRLYLPYLQIIRIEIERQPRNRNLSSKTFLHRLAGWLLPSLHSLEINSPNEGNRQDGLTGFLQSHHSTLQYLRLHYPRSGSLMSPGLVAHILTLCPKLTTLSVHIAFLPDFPIIPSHPNLDKLVLEFPYPSDRDAVDEMSQRVESFKQNLSIRCPKLTKGTLIGVDPNMAVRFLASFGKDEGGNERSHV